MLQQLQPSIWQCLDFCDKQFSELGMSLRDGGTQVIVLLSPHVFCLIKDSFCCVPICTEAHSSIQQQKVSL